jgi:hypothetical protein
VTRSLSGYAPTERRKPSRPAGDVLSGPGDPSYDLIVVGDAVLDIVQPETSDSPEETTALS